MAVGLNIDQILKDLERQKTAEEVFEETFTQLPTNQSVEPEVVEPEVVEPEVVEPKDTVLENVEKTDAEKTAELEKMAIECDAKGRIMARGLIDEIQKIASDLFSQEVEHTEDNEKVAELAQATILANLYKQIYN